VGDNPRISGGAGAAGVDEAGLATLCALIHSLAPAQAQDLEQALNLANEALNHANAQVHELMMMQGPDILFPPGKKDTLELREALMKLQKELQGEKKRTADMSHQLSTRDAVMQDMRRDHKMMREILHERERELLTFGNMTSKVLNLEQTNDKLNAEIMQRRQIEEELRKEVAELKQQSGDLRERAEGFRLEVFELEILNQGAQVALSRAAAAAEKGARLKVSDTFPLISFDDTTVLANDGQLINGENAGYPVEAELESLNLAVQNANCELLRQQVIVDNAIRDRDEARAQVEAAMHMIDSHKDLIEGLVAEKDKALTQWHAAKQSLQDFQGQKDKTMEATVQTLQFKRQECQELQLKLVLREEEMNMLQARLRQLQQVPQDRCPPPPPRESPHARALRTITRAVPPSGGAGQSGAGLGAGGEAGSQGTMRANAQIFDFRDNALEKERVDSVRSLEDALATIMDKTRQVQELKAEKTQLIESMNADQAALEAKLREAARRQASFEAERENFAVSMSLLRAEMEAQQEQLRKEMASECDRVARQRDELGEALRAKIESLLAELEGVRTLEGEKEHLESELSIAHGDCNRALKQVAVLEAQLQETRENLKVSARENQNLKVSMSLLRAETGALLEQIRAEMTSKCEILARQRDELGEALRAEKDGIETRLQAELQSVIGTLEEAKREKEQLESTLSIVHGDCDRSLAQVAPDLQLKNEELRNQAARDEATMLDALDLLSTRDRQLHDALAEKAELECKLDSQHLESSLEIRVLRATVQESQEQVHHLQRLLRLMRTRAPVTREQDQHSEEVRESPRDLRAYRHKEELLEKQVQELTQVVAALKIQILVFDELKVDGTKVKGEESQEEGEWQGSLRLKQQSIRDEMEASLQSSAGLKQMIQELQVV
jgi:chromosome segregation ATPase